MWSQWEWRGAEWGEAAGRNSNRRQTGNERKASSWDGAAFRRDQEECGANRVVKVTVRSLKTGLPPFKKPEAFLSSLPPLSRFPHPLEKVVSIGRIQSAEFIPGDWKRPPVVALVFFSAQTPILQLSRFDLEVFVRSRPMEGSRVCAPQNCMNVRSKKKRGKVQC